MSDKQPTHYSALLPSVDLGRRRFIATSALAASTVALVASAPGFVQGMVAAADVDPAFVELSRFLTGKPDLDARIVALAHQGLTAADSGFGDRAAALGVAIEQARLPDVDSFAASTLYADSGFKATAIAVISALYLGQVGSGDTARFVTFEKALMYRPTAGVVVIPTYALGGPNYWGTLTVPDD